MAILFGPWAVDDALGKSVWPAVRRHQKRLAGSMG